MKFVTVTAERAQADRYYGFDGWLVVFYVYAAWTAFSSATVSLAFLQFGQSTFPFDVLPLGDFQTLSVIRVVSLLPFLVLTPLKHRLMPIATIICEWINTAISSFLAVSLHKPMLDAIPRFLNGPMLQSGKPVDPGPMMVQFEMMAEIFVRIIIWNSILFGVAMTALFTWYLLASKRVNATYRQRLPSEVS